MWDHNAWTGQDKCLLVALQTELEKRIAEDSEAIVFEQVARKFFLVWRQVGARRDEHAKDFSLCWPLLLESQLWAAVGSRLHAGGTRTCPELRSSFHPNATQTARILCRCNQRFFRTRPNYMPMQPTLVTISIDIPYKCNPNRPNFMQCNFFLCRLRANHIQKQSTLVAISVNIPYTCAVSGPRRKVSPVFSGTAT